MEDQPDGANATEAQVHTSSTNPCGGTGTLIIFGSLMAILLVVIAVINWPAQRPKAVGVVPSRTTSTPKNIDDDLEDATVTSESPSTE